MHIDLSKYKGLSIKSIDLKELIGEDSIAAAQRSVPRNGGGSAFLVNVEHRNQMIADAITQVNGEPVIQPYLGWMKWNLKTQDFVVLAFDHMNSLTAKERDDFLAQIGAPVAASALP